MDFQKKRKLLKDIPNELSLIRLFSIPLLWMLAIFQYPFYLGVGILLAAFTDALDGYIARRYRLVTKLGSKLDTIADSFLTYSVAIWLAIYKPEIYVDHALLWIIGLGTCFISLLIGIIRFKRFANLHLYTTKVAAIIVGCFTIYTFIFYESYNIIFFYFAIGSFTLSNLEGIAVQLTHSKVDEHIGSIWFSWKKKRAKKS